MIKGYSIVVFLVGLFALTASDASAAVAPHSEEHEERGDARIEG